jgi:6-phosphogluconolactonase
MDRSANPSYHVFVGTYSNPSDPGVYVCSMDHSTGALTVIGQTSGLQNPTFLEAIPETGTLYVLSEEMDQNGKRSGSAAAFRYDSSSGTLTLLNQETTVPASTCHLKLDHTHRCLMVSSYHGGLMGVSPVLEDGRIGPVSEVHRHTGSSILPVQSQPRVHSVFVDSANRFAMVCDLGTDRIRIYKLDAAKPSLIPHGEAAVTPGSGPRHFAFHPTLPYGYVINELNSTITSFSYNGERGELTEIQTVPTLPSDYREENSCADIHLSPDGLFLYGSNRGHDSIAVYAVDRDSGALSLIEHVSTLGGHPRNFALSPDGKFLLAANRDGNNIVSFRRDADTGRLTPAGSILELPKPVCLHICSWEV